MSARRYSYPKFLDHQSIRLVRVAQPSAEAPECSVDHDAKAKPIEHLRLEVAQFPMGCEPPYRALSYTWGPPKDGMKRYAESDKISIVLGGEEHDVTPNLFDAIIQVGKTYPDSYFWVDALCINQGDLTERQLHVAIMDKIYNSASEVIVWLGVADDESEQVFQLVRAISGKGEDFFLAFGHSSAPEQLIAYGLPDPSDPIWGRYLDLYERRWFNRGWVIQEVVLARRALVHWGAHTIPWENLVAGSKIFLPERLRKSLFASFRKDSKHMDNLPLGRNVYRIGLIQDACIHRSHEQLLIVEICTGTHGLTSAEHVLVHLMRMSRDFSFGDPRDKIYALLGLINYTAQLLQVPPLDIRPDYSDASTEATVLTAGATAVIQQTKTLGIVAQVSDPSFRKVKGLPSWVPDFHRSPNFANGRRNLFTPSKIKFTGPSFRFEGLSLFVKATKLGTVTRTQDLEHNNRAENIVGMLDIALESVLPLGEDRMDVLWRTMIWDIYGHAHSADLYPSPSYLGDSFFSWLRSILAPETNRAESNLTAAHPRAMSFPINESMCEPLSPTDPFTARRLPQTLWNRMLNQHADPITFTSHASGVTWSQQLILLNNGHLGMGPKSGMEGDEVWILPDCPFPMVLRPLESGSYFVLGRSYIHGGVMTGQAVDESSVWEELHLE